MTFQINVAPSGHTFTCDIDDTVLTAGLHAGIGLPYGCKNGACGSCKGKVLSGSFEQKPHQARALSEAEKADGFALFCCVVPTSDLSIAVREVGGSSDYPVRKMPSRVATIAKVTADVAILTLQLLRR